MMRSTFSGARHFRRRRAAIELAFVCGVLGVVMSARGAAAQLASHEDTSARDSAAVHGAAPAGAPDETASPARPLGDPPFIGFWAAESRHASFRTRLGTRYHDLYLLGMRTGWAISTGRNVSLDYVVNAIPVAVMEGNPEYEFIENDPTCPSGQFCTLSGRERIIPTYHRVYGFGLAPLGLQLRLFTRSPVQLLVHANGGALWFAKPVPDPAATHFNFTAEGGGAVQWWFTRHEALSVGYEFHHTSNAATGDVNPGLNSVMLMMGLTRRPE